MDEPRSKDFPYYHLWRLTFFLFQQCLLRQNGYFLVQNIQFQMSVRHYILTQSKLLNAWNLGFGREYLPKKISPKPCTNNLWRCKPTAPLFSSTPSIYLCIIYFFFDKHSRNTGCSAAAQNFGFSHQTISRLIRTVKLMVQFDNFDNSWLSPRTELIVNSSVGLCQTELNGLLPALV